MRHVPSAISRSASTKSRTRSLERFGRALGSCALATTLVACTHAANVGTNGRHAWTHPGRLVIGTSDEPDNLNPMFAHSDATDQIDALIFAPVFRYDPHGEFVPELATVVPSYANGGISRDSKTITLHWRPNVRWSDGAPLTPRDLRFTWRVVTDKRNNTKALYGWDDIVAIDVPDDRTAIVRLKRPNANVLGIFGGGGGSAYPPLPEHRLRALHDLNTAAFNGAPISSGPWLLDAWHHGSSLEFRPNPTYWRGRPKLDALTYRIVPNPDTLLEQLRTHEVDLDASVGDAQVGAIEAVPGLRVVRHRSANWRRLAINCSRPALRDVRVRRAIAEAIDWNRLNATVYHGINERAKSDLPPDSWAAPNVPFYPYDVAGARRLLDAAGYAVRPGGTRAKGDAPLALTISATNKPGNEQAEVQMQQQLRAVGIELTIKNYPASLLFAQNGPLYGGTYDLEWSISTNGPDPDNQGDWSADFIPPKGANTSFLRDAIVTQTSDAAIRTFDRAKRKALYQREETRIHELVPTVFFYWQTQVAAYNDDLHGYRPAEYITDNWNSWEWSV
ncbi:MAG: peptide ABC transporter substrate-binding protein [Vulcanimicrobiaceae bacterium]